MNYGISQLQKKSKENVDSAKEAELAAQKKERALMKKEAQEGINNALKFYAFCSQLLCSDKRKFLLSGEWVTVMSAKDKKKQAQQVTEQPPAEDPQPPTEKPKVEKAKVCRPSNVN